jgi:hypothetical protein
MASIDSVSITRGTSTNASIAHDPSISRARGIAATFVRPSGPFGRKKTICPARNVVNETVRARDAPAN